MGKGDIQPYGLGIGTGRSARRRARRVANQWDELGLRPPNQFENTKDYAAQYDQVFDEFGYTDVLPGKYVDQDVQYASERHVARRNDRLIAEALGRGNALFGQGRGALQQGLSNLQTYRPGGAAALASGMYEGQANLYAAQAEFGLRGADARRTEAPDLMQSSRDAAIRSANRRAERAGMMQLGGQLLGAGLGLLTGGAGAAGVAAGAAAGGALGGQQQAPVQVQGQQQPQGSGITPLQQGPGGPVLQGGFSGQPQPGMVGPPMPFGMQMGQPVQGVPAAGGGPAVGPPAPGGGGFQPQGGGSGGGGQPGGASSSMSGGGSAAQGGAAGGMGGGAAAGAMGAGTATLSALSGLPPPTVQALILQRVGDENPATTFGSRLKQIIEADRPVWMREEPLPQEWEMEPAVWGGR